MRKKILFIVANLLFTFILIETASALPPPPKPPSENLTLDSFTLMPPPPPGGTMDGQPDGGPQNGSGKRTGKKQRGFTPKQTIIGIDASYSEDTQVYSIPLSYSLSPNFNLSASIPYISTTDNIEGIGNTLLSVKYLTDNNKKISFLATVGIYYPSSKEDLGLSQTSDGLVALSGLWNIMGSRIMGSASAIIRPDNNDKKGDYQSLFIGFDTPTDFLISQTSFYAASNVSQTSEDKINGMAQGNEQTLVDASLGFLLRRWNMRIGLTIPVSTESKAIDHSDRNVYFDLGFRYSL